MLLDGLKMYNNKSYKVPNTSKLLRLAQNAHYYYQKRKDEVKKQKEKDEKILAKEKEIAKNLKKEVTSITTVKLAPRL